MKCKSSGSTLIELEVHIFMIIIIFALSLTGYREIINVFNNCMETIENYNEFDDTYITLKNILNDENANRCEVKDNSIFVYCNDMYKIITNKNHNLKIDYYVFLEGTIETAAYEKYNLLLNDVDDFIVTKKGKLIYVEIFKGGTSYIMCL